MHFQMPKLPKLPPKIVKKKPRLKRHWTVKKEKSAEVCWTDTDDRRAGDVALTGVSKSSMLPLEPEKFEEAATALRHTAIQSESDREKMIYGFVIWASQQKRLKELIAAARRAKGLRDYTGGNAFSLFCQSVGFTPSDASKRGVAMRYALHQGIAPDGLVKFIGENGGIKGVGELARALEDALDGEMVVTLSARKKKGPLQPIAVFANPTLGYMALRSDGHKATDARGNPLSSAVTDALLQRIRHLFKLNKDKPPLPKRPN